jgi:cation:H+ antiporter
MAIAVVLLLFGTAMLTLGATSTIRGVRPLASWVGVPPMLIDIVLFGVSIESVGVALVAAGRGQASISAGDAFGTVVFLLSAGFGAGLLVARRPVEAPPPILVVLPAGAVAMCAVSLSDNIVTRSEGVVLLVIFALYGRLVLADPRTRGSLSSRIHPAVAERPRTKAPGVIFLLVGLALAYAGGSVLVDGGVRILGHTSLSAGFVGAAVIGALATVRQAVREILPNRRREPGGGAGELFGTVAAFTTGVLGLAAVIRPLAVDSTARSAFAVAAALYAVVATVFMVRGRAGRLTGLVVLVGYAAWIVWASGT